LPAAVLRRPPVPRATSGSETNDNRNLVEKTEQYERSIIMAELAKCEWNKTKAALALGVTRRILSYKMQTLGIDKPMPIVYNS
jgi:DNA-binding NtrC family response regulator